MSKSEKMKLLKNYDVDGYGLPYIVSPDKIRLLARQIRAKGLKLAHTLRTEEVREADKVRYRVHPISGAIQKVESRPKYRLICSPLLIRKRSGLAAKVRHNEKRIRAQKRGNGIVLHTKGHLRAKNEARKIGKQKTRFFNH